MSGGSLEYAYFKIDEVAGMIKHRSDKGVLIDAFADHLEEISHVLHEIEWYFSGDCGIDRPEKAIKEYFGEQVKDIGLKNIQKQLDALQKELNKLK